MLVVDGLDEPGAWASGGAAGAAGTPGHGGPGGAGGAGGKPFHWTTEHWDPRQVHHAAEHDNEGKVTKQAWTETVYDKRIEHHTTPGGRDGPRGASGAPGRAGSAGMRGRDGTVSIQCGGTYQRRFELSVAAFDVVAKGTPATPSAANDQIYEFGEVCHAESIQLANKAGAGRAPSPSHQRVRVRLRDTRWVTKVSDAFCAQSIQAGARSTFLEGAMTFQIGHDARCTFRSASTTTEFARTDLGPNASFGFDPIVERVEVRAIPLQLGIEDASGRGCATGDRTRHPAITDG